MAIDIIKRVAVAAESTFATSASAYSSYAAVPAMEIVFTPEREFIDRPVQTANLAEKHPGVVGGKGGTVTFKVPVAGLSTAAIASTEAVPHPWQSRLLVACAYAETLNTGTTVSGGSSTTTSIDVTDASDIAVGSAVLINSEVRIVTAVNTAATPDNITVTPALSSAPANTDVVRASARYIPTDADPGTCTLALAGDGFTRLMKGCKGTVKMSVTARGLLVHEYSFQCDDWSTTAPSGTFPTLTLPAGITALAAPFYWGTTLTPVAEFTFDPAITITARPSTGGTNGRSGWVATDGVPVASAKPYFATAFQTDFDAGTERALFWYAGTTGTASFSVYAHKTSISAYPGEKSVDGILGHELAFKVNSSASSTVPTSFALNFC